MWLYIIENDLCISQFIQLDIFYLSLFIHQFRKSNDEIYKPLAIE